jgi:hypothetical protein
MSNGCNGCTSQTGDQPGPQILQRIRQQAGRHVVIWSCGQASGLRQAVSCQASVRQSVSCQASASHSGLRQPASQAHVRTTQYPPSLRRFCPSLPAIHSPCLCTACFIHPAMDATSPPDHQTTRPPHQAATLRQALRPLGH